MPDREKFAAKVRDRLNYLSTEEEVAEAWDFGEQGYEYEFKDGSRLYVEISNTRESDSESA